MFCQGDGGDLTCFFHLVDDKRYHGEVKHTRWRVEMKGQFCFMLEMNMEFELIEVNFNGLFGFFFHFFHFDEILNN